MSIIDIIIYSLLILFIIIGFIKGFTMKRINWFLTLTSFTLAFLLGIPLARLIMNTNIGNGWLQTLICDALPNEGVFIENLSNESAQATIQLQNGLSILKIPKIFHQLFIDEVLEFSLTVKDALSSSIAFLILIAVAVIFIAIVILILLFAIIKPTWKKLFGENGKNIMGRFAGMLTGLIKLCLLLVIVFSLVNIVDTLMLTFKVDAFHLWLSKQLYLDKPESFSIGKLFYHATSWLWGWISTISTAKA